MRCIWLIWLTLKIIYYSLKAPEIIPDNRPDPNWPEDGSIQFDEYATRYRPGLDLVLKNVSCYIPGGQKVSTYT